MLQASLSKALCSRVSFPSYAPARRLTLDPSERADREDWRHILGCFSGLLQFNSVCVCEKPTSLLMLQIAHVRADEAYRALR
jgi:hypothetical protein